MFDYSKVFQVQVDTRHHLHKTYISFKCNKSDIRVPFLLCKGGRLRMLPACVAAFIVCFHVEHKAVQFKLLEQWKSQVKSAGVKKNLRCRKMWKENLQNKQTNIQSKLNNKDMQCCEANGKKPRRFRIQGCTFVYLLNNKHESFHVLQFELGACC